MTKQELEAKIVEYRFMPIQEELFDYFFQYEALCRPKTDRLDLAILYFYMGEAYFRLGNHDKTILYMNKSLLVEKPDDKKDFDASAYNILGLMFTFTGQEVIAIENYISALEIAQKYHLHNRIAIIYINLGWLYRDLGDYNLAVESYHTALEELQQSTEESFYNAEVLCHAYLGQIYHKTGQYKKALQTKATIEQLMSKNKTIFYDASLQDFFIRIYTYLGESEKANEYLEHMLTLASSPQDFLEFYEFYIDICEFAMQHNMKEIACRFLKELHKNADAIDLDFIRLRVQALEVTYRQKYCDTDAYMTACQEQMIIFQKYNTSLKSAKLSSINLIQSLNKVKQEKQHFEELSRRDSMTNLFNKQTIQFLIEEFLETHTNELSALIMIDIDKFKQVNDTFGHLTGDEVITTISKKIKSYFHSSSVGRFGGDEFLILVRKTDSRDTLLATLSSLCENVSQMHLSEDSDYKITLSCGVLFLENGTSSFETSVSSVDQALYKAKENGRNQIVIAES